MCWRFRTHFSPLFFHIEMTFNLKSFPPVFLLYITCRLCWASEFTSYGKLPQISWRLEEKKKKKKLYIERFVYTCSVWLISNRTYVCITELCGSLRDQSRTPWTTQLSAGACVIHCICSLLCYCLLQQRNPGLQGCKYTWDQRWHLALSPVRLHLFLVQTVVLLWHTLSWTRFSQRVCQLVSSQAYLFIYSYSSLFCLGSCMCC